jgi:hypothetical protein
MATLAEMVDLTIEGPDTLGVLATTAPVVAAARSVRIVPEALAAIAKEVAVRAERGTLVVPPWDKHYHWHDDRGRAVNVTLLLDALNFSFWAEPGEGRWTLTYDGEALDGYWALAAALKRAIEVDGCPLWDADFLQQIGDEDTENTVIASRRW